MLPVDKIGPRSLVRFTYIKAAWISADVIELATSYNSIISYLCTKTNWPRESLGVLFPQAPEDSPRAPTRGAGSVGTGCSGTGGFLVAWATQRWDEPWV